METLPDMDRAVRERLAADPELAAYVDKIINGAELWMASASQAVVAYKVALVALVDSLGVGSVDLDVDLGEHNAVYGRHGLRIERDGTVLKSIAVEYPGPSGV